MPIYSTWTLLERIDAFIGDIDTSKTLIEFEKLSDRLEISGYRHVQMDDSYFVLSRRSRHYSSRAEIETALQQLFDEGVVSEIRKRYGVPVETVVP